jgi:xanthine/CO dehydrogenase XdhC/CoxF family maturation factor
MNVTQEFDAIHQAAMTLDLTRDVADAALVTITETRGSTFRRAGASMLVARDGRLVSELAGGCPQRDIVLRATQVMDAGTPAIVAYAPDSNYDVMLETGCGGELKVLIEPFRTSKDIEFLQAIARLRSLRQAGVLATMYGVDDSALSPRPQRLLLGEGLRWTNIDDGALQESVGNAVISMNGNATAIHRQIMSRGNICDVFFEPLQVPHALVIVGDDLVARRLAELSLQLGWETILVDPSQIMPELPPGARHLIASPSLLGTQPFLDRSASVVVMTHRLERDLAYLGALLQTPAAYLGMIGSRQRAAQVRQALPAANGRLHIPAGLDIGSETPQEIALAIAAEILATRSGRGGEALAHSQRPIHA